MDFLLVRGAPAPALVVMGDDSVAILSSESPCTSNMVIRDEI